MKKTFFLPLAACAALASQADIIVNISGADTQTSNPVFTTYNGVTWNRVDNSPVTSSFELRDSSGALSGITYSYSSAASGFASNANGQGDPSAAGSSGIASWSTGTDSGVTLTATGQFMPWAVLDSYIAQNTANETYSITLTSATQLSYAFTLANSRTGITGGATSYNVGGAYNATTDSFDGGTTLTLTAGTDQATGVEFDMGVLRPSPSGYFASTWNGSAYAITLQVGKLGTPSGSNAAYLNGLIVTAIPEPGTLALVGLALGTLLLFRRKR